MTVYLIRHGKTRGNLERRYVGRTDESLCQQGRQELERCIVLKADTIYASPMKRCIETAQILYPNQKIEMVEDFRECDFGAFEYKNYQDLKENREYQKFIDTMGKSGFPDGEDTNDFKRRCQRAFLDVMKKCQCEEVISFVVHGGTIMSILEKFAVPHKEYYSWQIGNGEGYVAEAAWEKDEKLMLRQVCKKGFRLE